MPPKGVCTETPEAVMLIEPKGPKSPRAMDEAVLQIQSQMSSFDPWMCTGPAAEGARRGEASGTNRGDAGRVMGRARIRWRLRRRATGCSARARTHEAVNRVERELAGHATLWCLWQGAGGFASGEGRGVGGSSQGLEGGHVGEPGDGWHLGREDCLDRCIQGVDCHAAGHRAYGGSGKEGRGRQKSDESVCGRD